MHNDGLRRRITLVLGGMMYALCAAFGWQAEHYGESRIALGLLVSAGLALPAMALLRLLFDRSEKAAGRKKEGGRFAAGKAFVLLLVCYTPMFLIAFPGSFAYDVPF